MKTVIAVLCGLPGAGKTQFVHEFVNSKPQFNIIHVNYDKIIPKDSNLVEEEWKERRKSILHSVEAYLRPNSEEKVPSWLSEDHFSDQAPLIIIIDDNNFLSSMRYEYYQLCRSLEIGFCQIELKASLDLSLHRNKELRPKEESISSDVIHKMHSKFESPNPLKNHWEVLSFQIDSSQDLVNSFEMIQTVLHTALENPVKDIITESKLKADASRSACNASVIHQADNLLRKKVNVSIKQVKEDPQLSQGDRQARIQRIVEGKKELLEDLKTGHTQVPSDIVRLLGSKEHKSLILNQLSDELDRLLEDKLNLS